MRFHWSYKSLPEFANVLPAERDRVWKLCHARANRHPLTWFVWGTWTLLTTTPYLLIKLFGIIVIPRELVTTRFNFVTGLGLGIGTFILWALVASQIHIWLARRHISAELTGHCRGCGYDLTGNVSGNCPECGKVT